MQVNKHKQQQIKPGDKLTNWRGTGVKLEKNWRKTGDELESLRAAEKRLPALMVKVNERKLRTTQSTFKPLRHFGDTGIFRVWRCFRTFENIWRHF